MKTPQTHEAHVFLPGSVGPMRRDVVLLSDFETYVSALGSELDDALVGWGAVRLELAALKSRLPGGVVPDRDGLVATVCVLKSQGLGNLASAVSDALAVLESARLNSSAVSQSGARRMSMQLVIGNRYNWKSQPERLVYLGMCEPRNGRWHQFAKVEAPEVVWCEVLTSDLHMLEETKPDNGDQGGDV